MIILIQGESGTGLTLLLQRLMTDYGYRQNILNYKDSAFDKAFIKLIAETNSTDYQNTKVLIGIDDIQKNELVSLTHRIKESWRVKGQSFILCQKGINDKVNQSLADMVITLSHDADLIQRLISKEPFDLFYGGLAIKMNF